MTCLSLCPSIVVFQTKCLIFFFRDKLHHGYELSMLCQVQPDRRRGKKNKCETNCDKECQTSDKNKDEFIAEYQLETVEDEEEGDEDEEGGDEEHLPMT